MKGWEIDQKYKEWWRGKYCRIAGSDKEYKLVKALNIVGPPSRVYCQVQLIYADGTDEIIHHTGHRPRKYDVEVCSDFQS